MKLIGSVCHMCLQKHFTTALTRTLIVSCGFFPPRSMLAYVYVPLLQKELDTFKDTVWNNHRGRKQRNKHLPDGIPDHNYQFPDQYGGIKCRIHVSDEDLEEVAEVSNILEHSSLNSVQNVKGYFLKRTKFLQMKPYLPSIS